MSAKILPFKMKENKPQALPEDSDGALEMALNDLKARFSPEELTEMFTELDELADLEDEAEVMDMVDGES